MSESISSDKPTPSQALRRRAAEVLRAEPRTTPTWPTQDVQALIGQLNLRQRELELETQRLRQSQIELAHARDRLARMYELSPVGDLVLNQEGRILQVNLTAAHLLGYSQEKLLRSKFSDFVSPDSQEAWALYHQAIFDNSGVCSPAAPDATDPAAAETKEVADRQEILKTHAQREDGRSGAHTCGIKMRRGDRTTFLGRLESIAWGGASSHCCRTALLNVTTAHRTRQQLQQDNEQLARQVAEDSHEIGLLAAAVSHLAEGVLITTDDVDWPGPTIVFVNRAMCEITGYAAEELVGMTPRILQGEGTQRQSLDRLKTDLAAGRPTCAELINYRKDGTPYDAEVEITSLLDPQGSRTNFVSIHRDITHRKQYEQALRESDARTTGILASISAHIAVIDQAGTIVAVNPAWEDFARQNGGVIPRCGVGANYLEVCQQAKGLTGEQAQRVINGLRAVLDRAAAVFSMEYPCHSPTTKRWFLLQATPLRSAQGGAVVSHTDITDRVKAEHRLRASEERTRAILNTAADAIVTIDRHGIIESVNPATEQLFGYRQEELVGQNVKMLMPRPYCDQHDHYIARYLETGQTTIIGTGREVVGRRKDGSTFPIDLAVSAINQHGFTGIIRDISEHKELQKHVLEIATEEQRRIGQELHDGTGQELTALALYAGTLEQMLHGASRLSGPEETLKLEKAEDAESAGNPEDAGESAPGQPRWGFSEERFRQLREITGRLIDGLAQANRHVHELCYGIMPVQIGAEGLRSALEELATATNTLQNIKCHFWSTNNIAVDNTTTATHLYRIAQEALNNALRHSHAEEVHILLSQTAHQLVLEVRDNGVGFDPTTRHRSGPASGMGLRTMEYRAGMIGGLLHIERRQGGGTLVRCTVSQKGGADCEPATNTSQGSDR